MPDMVRDARYAGPLDSITDAEVLDVDVRDLDDEQQAKPAPPDPRALERSIRRRRHELIEHLNQLERVVRAKLDVRARLRRSGERAALRAGSLLEQLVERVRERPLPFLVAGGLVFWMLFRPRRRYISF